MMTDESVQLFKQSVDQAQSIFIFVSAQAKFDQVASALALSEGLQQQGKEVYLLSPAPLKENFADLHGVEHFTQQIGNKNLQVSFDYQVDMVDKVSYNIDEEAKKFYLIIQPKKGTPPLDSKTVQFSYTGANVDLLITIGVTNLESLENLYHGYENLFSENNVVSIHMFDTEYGTVKLNTAGTVAFSESIARLLPALGISLTPEMATNLLAGVQMMTDDLRSAAVTADTFELVSQLMRAGGRRLPVNKISAPLVTKSVSTLPLNPTPTLNLAQTQVQTPTPSTNGFAEIMNKNKSKLRRPSTPISEIPRMEGGTRA